MKKCVKAGSNRICKVNYDHDVFVTPVADVVDGNAENEQDVLKTNDKDTNMNTNKRSNSNGSNNTDCQLIVSTTKDDD